ncbi:ribosomal RNA processing protein 1 homolog isoform X2 [Neocloeon triangulifer]|uniref:ribosomal RNA processing protein 1 homolog isoform X2 n=1 Tax=Neocloeon triangulifer TaxID=2078957 RepID=UPI00286FAE46|nr:ribosomal RNA processing protein 1 homolog isoform X2 [Neocloeon triangulifer]
MVNCKEKKKTKSKNGKKQILTISQEVEFVQKLADNDVRMRDRALKKLKRWLQDKTKSDGTFSKEDMMILWRGLFYCMWNSDKPIIQEELCDNMASLINSIQNDRDVILFIEGFLLTVRYEWMNIDSFRLDKYKMLVRRVLRLMLSRISLDDWKLVSIFGDLIWDKILNPDKTPPPPIGLSLHICEIFFQEVAKNSKTNDVTQMAVEALLKPFIICLATNSTDSRLRDAIDESVLGYLIDQSDVGIEQSEKINAWKLMGCPAITLDQIERDEAEAEDEENGSDSDEDVDAENLLDPRAGQMDVELPQLDFDYAKMASMIEKFSQVKNLNSKAKKAVKAAAKKFWDLAKDVHPVPFEVPVKEEDVKILSRKPRNSTKRAAESLMKFEEDLFKDTGKMHKMNRNKSNVCDESKESPPQVELVKQKKTPKILSPKAEEPPVKRRRKRSSLGPIGNWEVTEVGNWTVTEVGSMLVTSPGNVGHWNVSVVNEKVPEEQSTPSSGDNDWSKPLKDGEYEFFVAPKKSPKRRSLYKAPPDEEILAEKHSPTDIGPIIDESPKSRRMETKEAVDESNSPSTPIRKARVSLPANTRASELIKCAKTSRPRNSLLLPALTNSAQRKRVSICLDRNKAQEVHEYVQQLRSSPNNPHDSEKKPVQGLLKGSPVPFKRMMEKFKNNI